VGNRKKNTPAAAGGGTAAASVCEQGLLQAWWQVSISAEVCSLGRWPSFAHCWSSGLSSPIQHLRTFFFLFFTQFSRIPCI